jgi:hypothetical protein
MNVERTMEFILRMQAKSEARAERADARADKFDKRLEATRKLVDTGMKLLVKIEKNQAESKKDFDHRLNALLEAQKKTDQKLDRLIDFWGKRRSNGHPN